MLRRPSLALLWALVVSLGCQDPTAARPPRVAFGFLALTFQGHQLKFYTGIDSTMAARGATGAVRGASRSGHWHSQQCLQ